ncbi:TonB-dependent receptor [Pseudovibrio exalbescens]|uniref:TonB-dependent receptor n=1 Tax=Pseudovibrio exalbescens TaxID=197461 RepID=UPI000C9C7C79|nr:TonB-dependent receptor [Pseudovibrio exalbescens]
MTSRTLVLALFSGLAVAPAAAQQADDGALLLDEIIVTANRTSSELAAVAQSVVVINQQQIQEVGYGSRDLTDVISTLVPGFQRSNQTLSGGSETFRGRNVLIMVDGVARNTPLRKNSRILSLIDINTVERIEVINGASSLYGADATGGTINIITKRGWSETPEVSLTTGLSAHTENPAKSLAPSASLSVEGYHDRIDYFFSGSGEFTQRAYDGAGREMPSDVLLGQGGMDRAKQFNLFGGLGFEEGTRRFDVTADWTYFRQDPDYLSNYNTDPVSPDFGTDYTGEPAEENSQYLSATMSETDFAIGELELKGFFNNIEKQSPFTAYDPVANSFVYTVNGTEKFNQTVLKAKRAGLSATVHTQLDQVFDGAAITWGTEYSFDHTTQQFADGADAIAPMTQNQFAAFAQLEVPVHERVRLQGGARFDQFFLNVDDFTRPTYKSSLLPVIPAVNVAGGSFSYNSPTFNIGAVVDITENLQAFGNFSQGYSLTDIGAFTRRAGLNSTSELGKLLGGQRNFDYADIAPEPQIVNSYEAGLRGDWGGFRGAVSGYISTSDNGTTFDIDANQVSQQEEMVWGAEVTAAYDLLDTVTVGGTFAYTDGLYDGEGTGDLNTRLPNNRVPNRFTSSLYGEWLLPHDFLARAEVEYFSGRKARPQNDEQELKGATLLNLGLSKDFGDAGEFSFAVRNVFDTDYTNPTATAVRGYKVAGQGRVITLQHKIRF